MKDSLQVFAGATDGVWGVDAAHRIVLWNQAAEALLGYAAQEALGQLCHALLQGRDAGGSSACRAGCSVGRAAAQGELCEPFSIQVRRRDGTWCWIEVRTITLPPESPAGQEAVLVHQARRLGDDAGWAPGLRLHLLGTVAVQRPNGSWVDGPLWRRARVRALLVLLAREAGRPMHRDVLLETLWSGRERHTALSNLNTTVYQLRRCLEPALERGAESRYVLYEAGSYRLAGNPPTWQDVDAFGRGVALGRQERVPVRAIALYREAIGLYQGDYVSGLDPDLLQSWMERDRLKQLYLTALEELCALLENCGEIAQAEEACLKALAEDPCREGAAVMLMRLALKRGDRAAAVAHYRRLERAQRRELQVRPSEAARQLYEEARVEE